jgi:DUF971 family protein
MTSHQMPVSEPEHIAISKSKGIQIEWKDGHHSAYTLQYLRDHCPCASCTGAHGAGAAQPPLGPFQMYRPALRLEGVEPVGHYAIRLRWNDGHRTGIYSYDHFRGICPCPACQAFASPR